MTETWSAALGLLLLRVMVGVVMLAHGINHVFLGGKIAGVTRWFASMGMRPAAFHAWLASLVEIVGGAMLVVGLLTPLAAAATLGVMTVAFIINHRKNGFFIFRPGEGWEYVGSLIMSGLALGAMGPGKASLDNALGFEWVSGLGAFAITAVVGLGGAALLLLVFWRPEPKA